VLDLRLIREQPDAVARALADKGGAELIQDIVTRDAERRRLVKEADDLKALRNRTSAELARYRGAVP
jgi:seryl-tRNA synthetase